MGELAEALIEEEMFGGDDEDGWEGYHEERRAKKMSNHEQSLKLLAFKGIKVKKLSDWHYRVGEYDFWPSTGKFMHMKTKERGRGVFNLLTKLKIN